MRIVLKECLALLDHGLEQFPWHHKRAYADWLAQTYYYVHHSTRLLAASAARFPLDERGNAFHNRFGAHLSEEKKHELLALHDIKKLGLALGEFPEHDATRMFYEPQYFKIEHQDPLALFGYILPLEAMSVSKGKWILQRVLELHGNHAGSFLRVHAEDDVDHLEKAFTVLEGVASEQRVLIELNMRQTTFAYLAMLAEMRRLADPLSSASSLTLEPTQAVG
jgi:hypothetical protein